MQKKSAMKKLIDFTTMLVIMLICNNAFALDAPELTVSTSGLDVSLSWTTISGAANYRLYYAPYPYKGEDTIGFVDMGTNISISGILWEGASYYVAVTASDNYVSSESGCSNIELFKIETSISEPELDECGVPSGDGSSCSCEINCDDSIEGFEIPSYLENYIKPCLVRYNDDYEIAFFELCGNDHISIPEPYRVKPEKETIQDRYVTLWMEVNAPWGVDGTVWFDAICLNIGENKATNFAPNPAYCLGLHTGWDSKVNPMKKRYPEYEVCSLGDTDPDCTAWEGIDSDNSKYSTSSLKVKVKAGHRYHTYIDYQHFIDLNDYPIGTKINASVWVKIEGDVQVRLGLDFRDTVASSPDKMVNGKIIQFPVNGPHLMDWTLLRLD